MQYCYLLEDIQWNLKLFFLLQFFPDWLNYPCLAWRQWCISRSCKSVQVFWEWTWGKCILWVICYLMAHTTTSIFSILGHQNFKVCLHGQFDLTSFGYILVPLAYLLLLLAFSSYDLLNYLNLSEIYPTVVYYVFNTMLLMLLVFHIYWWVLICSMIRRQLKNRGKVGEDIRSGKPF